MVALGSGPGPAEPAVRWEAPPECGTADDLRERVTQQRGALEAGIEIVGRVARAEGLYALELELVLGGERQHRSFSATDCRTLLDAAVLVSSAALGPGAEQAPVVPEPAHSPAVPDEPAPVRAPEGPSRADPTRPVAARAAPVRAAPVRAAGPTATTSPTRARGLEPGAAGPRVARPSRWRVLARGGVGYGGDLATPMGSLGAGHAWRRVRVEGLVDALGGRAHGPRGALDLRVVTVSPRACATLRMRAPIELSPCGGLALGIAVGRGRDVPNARTAVVPWLAGELGFGVRVRARPWLAVGLELSNYAMLGRPLFVLSNGETVHRAGAAGSRALLTFELRVPATDRARAGH